MFGFSEGIDYSSLTAVLMRIGVVAEVITADHLQPASCLVSFERHFGPEPRI
jgi:hypothetical protein